MTQRIFDIENEKECEKLKRKRHELFAEKFSGLKIELDRPLETEDIAYTLRSISYMIDEGCKNGMLSWGVNWYLLKEEK